MKILMLISYPTIRGPFPKILPPLVTVLRELGIEVVTEHWGAHKDDESYFEKFTGRIGDIKRILKVVKEQNFDLMVIHTAHDWAAIIRDIPLILLSQRHKQSVVLQLHGTYPHQLFPWRYFLHQRASMLLVQLSKAVLLLSSEEIREWKRFYPPGNYQLVSNAFLPEIVSTPYDLKDKIGGATTENLRLLYVGRLIREKGVYDLIEAFSKLQKRMAYRLSIVGDGIERSQLEKEVKKQGLGDYVQFTGYLRGQQLYNAYKNSHIFVLASWSEGLPVVLLEAMNAGLPIVTTRLRGALDYLQDGIHAIFVPARDPTALAAGLTTVLENAELRNKMSKANLQKVKEFSPENVGRNYFAVLSGIMDANKESH
jgi:glycosyltransferase involved in cell wall biosynthesis